MKLIRYLICKVMFIFILTIQQHSILIMIWIVFHVYTPHPKNAIHITQATVSPTLFFCTL